MSPDKKYMAEQSNKGTDNLNLVPFKTSMPSNMPMGWIPVYTFNNLNQPGNSLFPLPNLSNMYNSPNYKNMMNTPNSNYSSTNNMSNSNIENFPSDENADNLFSYNKPNNLNNTNNMVSNNTSNTSPLTKNIDRSENISEVLRNYTADLDENIDLCRHCTDKRIDKIYEKIQENDPEIISMLIENYSIPCPIAKIIIRKIIKLSLQYCKKAGD